MAAVMGCNKVFNPDLKISIISSKQDAGRARCVTHGRRLAIRYCGALREWGQIDLEFQTAEFNPACDRMNPVTPFESRDFVGALPYCSNTGVTRFGFYLILRFHRYQSLSARCP